MKQDTVYEKVSAIHDLALSNLRALKLPPYPAHYKRFFDKIFQEQADKELQDAMDESVSLNEKIDNIAKYLELAQLAVQSFIESHSDIARIAELQNDYLIQASKEMENYSGETCVQLVGGLTRLGADMTQELKKADSKIQNLSVQLKEALQEVTVDNLTQVFNRKALMQDMQTVLAAGIDKDLTTSLLMIDADNFKTLNDEYGHVAGDKILIYLAQTIKASIRSADRVYRFGGEEFAVVLHRCPHNMAVSIAEKIRTKIENSNLIYNGKTMQITVSIGLTNHQAKDTFDTLCERADQALYQAKREGKNKVITKL